MDTAQPRTVALVNPEGECRVEQKSLAPRLRDLNGKSIGFIDNHKTNADLFLAAIRDMLVAEFPDVKTHTVRKNFSACYLIANELDGKVDAVVNAWGD
jgi:hypothetical protein